MPVDPVIKKVAEEISKSMPSSREGVEPSRIREISRQNRSFFYTDVQITSVEEIKIPVDGTTIRGRIYSNSQNEGPAIVYFHGGGFVTGDLDSYDWICRYIAKFSGAKVISVEYRLAPEFRFPTAVNDAFESYRWIRENSDKLGIVEGQLAVMGDSAGGNLCAVISIRAIEEGYPLPVLSVMFYPMITPDYISESYREYSSEFLLKPETMKWYQGHYLNNLSEASSPYYSPIFFNDLEKMPETIVISAEFDILRDQAETFSYELRKRNVPGTCIRALGMIHGFLTYSGISESARDILVMVSKLTGHKLVEGKGK